MNVTLLALSLSRGVMSPLFSNTRLTASKVHMSRQFSPFFYASSFLSTLKLSGSSFINTLASPVVIENADADYYNKRITETLVLSDEKRQWTINKCIFVQCQSDDNGGGVNLNNDGATLKISNSGFMKCTGLSGGGLFASTGYVDLVDVCFSDCKGDKYQAFQLSVEKITSISHCHVCKMSDDETTSSIAGVISESISMKNTNFSNNNVPEAKALCYLYGGMNKFDAQFTASFLNFDRSTAQTICYVQCNRDQTMDTANFVKNTGKEYLIENAAYAMTFQKFYIRNDQSKMFNSQFASFKSCVFDCKAKEAAGKITDKASTNDCSFEKDKTVDVKIHNSVACWGNPKTASQDDDADWGEEESGGKGLVIGIIALVAALGVIGYVAYNKLFNRRGTDTRMLMYV